MNMRRAEMGGRRWAGVFVVCVLPTALATALTTACGSPSGSQFTPDGGHDASSRDATVGDSRVRDTGSHESSMLSSGDTGPQGGDASCIEGQACGDGGVCAGGACCASQAACGATCCASGRVCSFNTCVQPGATCFDSTGCSAGEYCQYSVVPHSDAGGATTDASCVSGVLPSGVCLPTPPTCPDAGAPDGASCIESCQYHPAPGPFMPALKYSWGGLATNTPNDVMMAPIVLPLEDTNCDGKINSLDIPDIVFSTFVKGAYSNNGTLHAISVRNAAAEGGVTPQLVDRWSVPGPIPIATDGGMEMFQINPGKSLAGGDLDGMQGAEIVACLVRTVTKDGGTTSSTSGVAAFHPDGSLYWAVAGPVCSMPSIADLSQNGMPEVVVEGGILNGQTGALVAQFTVPEGDGGLFAPSLNIGNFVISDITGDGFLDIVASNAGYDGRTGKEFVNTGGNGTFVAIGDLNGDGKPEVIATTGTSAVSIWRYTGAPDASTGLGAFEWVQKNININAAATIGATDASVCDPTTGGGPPTVADFNGDGTPDIALAGAINYTILNGKTLTQQPYVDGGNPNSQQFFLWDYYPTDDCSSRETGSTIFDFTGDGKPEALYSDQQKLRIFNGPDGTPLFETCNTTGTLVEYPLVVDVDNDGHADIIVASNAYATANVDIQCQEIENGPLGESGIRVYSDPNLAWVRTRAIWNEHAYHVTNVNDDGTIPRKELPNWQQAGLNNFRQNKQPGYEFAAPNAVVSLRLGCSQPLTLIATVLNIGQAELPAGVEVDFYGAGTKLGSAVTSVALYPAQSESIAFPTTSGGPFYAWVDPPTAPPHPAWHQCRTNNNTSATVTFTAGCPMPK